jgi:Trk K+ transport system NAD-binding subunit
LTELGERPNLILETKGVDAQDLTSAEIDVAGVDVTSCSELPGQTLSQVDFRRRFGVNVLALYRDGVLLLENLQDEPLCQNDRLFCQGPRAQIDALRLGWVMLLD